MISQKNKFNVKSYRDAIRKNNLEQIKQLITKENVNEPVFGGIRPIHLAAMDGNEVILYYLLQLDADLKATDLKGNGVLYYAAKNKKCCYVAEWLFLAIIANKLMPNEREVFLKNSYDNPIDFIFLINYLVASPKNQKKNLNLMSDKNRKNFKTNLSKVEDILKSQNISLKTQTDIVDILKGSGTNEFCYVKFLFLSACLFGNTEILEYLINRRKEMIENELLKENISEALFLERSRKIMEEYINQKDDTGWTLLHQACEYGYKDIVEILMKNGARTNIHTEDETDVDVIFRAICKEDIEILNILFDNGAISQFNDDELKELFINIIARQTFKTEGKISSNVMNLLYEKGLFSLKMKNGMNFFHFLASNVDYFDFNMFKNLKINEKDLQQGDNEHLIPLDWAIARNTPKLVEFLLSKMKFEGTSNNNLINLIYFIANNSVKKGIKEILCNKLNELIKTNNEELNKKFPNIGNLLNEINALGKTDNENINDYLRNNILDAIERNDVEKLKLFSCKDQFLSEFRDDDGRSLLWYATENCKEEVSIYLLELGIFDKNETDKGNNNESLLMLACDNNLNKFAKVLIEKKVDITLLNKEGIDIYQKACITDNKYILKCLKENFKNDWKNQINKKFGDYGQNLLIMAAYYSNNKVLSFLINEEVNVDSVDKLGKTALMYAYDFENYEAMELLLNAKANPKKEYLESASLKKIQKWMDNREKLINRRVNKTKVLSDKIHKEELKQSKGYPLG